MKKIILALGIITTLLFSAVDAKAVTVKVVIENDTANVFNVEMYGEWDTGMFPAPIGGFITNGISANSTNVFYIDIGPSLDLITWYTVNWTTEAIPCEVCCYGYIDSWIWGTDGDVPAGSLDPSDTQLTIRLTDSGGYDTCLEDWTGGGTALFGPPDEC